MLRRAVARRVIVKYTSGYFTISPGLLAAFGPGASLHRPWHQGCLYGRPQAGGFFAAEASVARGSIADRPAGCLVLATRLLLGRYILHGASLRRDALFIFLLRLGSLGRRFGKVGETFTAEVLEHLTDDRSGKLEVQGEALRVGEGLVCVPLVAEGTERPEDVLGRHEGVAASRHAQVLEERKIQTPHHADNRLGLVDAPPHEETCIVAIDPASQDLVLERLMEPADHAADLILTTSALLECGLVDHQRGFMTLP